MDVDAEDRQDPLRSVGVRVRRGERMDGSVSSVALGGHGNLSQVHSSRQLAGSTSGLDADLGGCTFVLSLNSCVIMDKFPAPWASVSLPIKLGYWAPGPG